MTDEPLDLSELNLKSLLQRAFRDRVEVTTRELRDLADMIEMLAKRIESIPTAGMTSVGYLAGRIVHAAAWGLANSNLDSIVTAAAEYDYYMSREIPDVRS